MQYSNTSPSGFETVSDQLQDEVQTVTASGAPAKRRITSILTARDLFEKSLLLFEPDATRRARLRGQIDGAPPYSQSDLDERCMGNMVNENFLEMSSILDQKASQWHEVFHEVPTLVEFFKAPGLAEIFDDYARILAEEFHALLMSWSGFLTFMDKVRREADAYGIGPAVFSDAWDWRPKAFSAGSFYYDPSAKLDPETIEYFFLEDYDNTAGDLYRWAFANEKQAKNEGWHHEAVKKLLVSVFFDKQAQNEKTFPVSIWEECQQKIRNGHYSVEIKEFERVKLIHLFVKEVASGKLSHYIFSDKQLGENAEEDDFLFVEEEAYDKVANVLWYLPFNGGDGYLKSVRGLASKIEGHCDLSNRYLGQIYTAGFMSASVMLQPKTGGDFINAPMIRAGAMTILPPDMNVIQRSTMVPEVGSLIPLRNLSLSIMRNNTGVWREHSEVTIEQQADKTARQVAEESAKEARFEKAAVQFDYGYLERLYKEMWRRVTNTKYLKSVIERPGVAEARGFIDRCKLRGVPPEVLMDLGKLFDLHASRAIGMGSWGLKLDITNQLMGLSNSLDERGRRNVLRDYVQVRVGAHNVDRYVESFNRDTVPTDESSHATLENNDLGEGSKVLASSDQWHVTHLQVHSPILVEIIKGVEANQISDPRKALQILQVTLEHVEAHWQFVANDPTRRDIAKQTAELLKQGSAAAKPLMQAVQAIAAAEAKLQEEQQQVVQGAKDIIKSREQELEAIKIRGQLENESTKQQSLNQMRRDKTIEQNGINRERMQREMQLKAERQAVELELERQKTAAKTEKKA